MLHYMAKICWRGLHLSVSRPSRNRVRTPVLRDQLIAVNTHLDFVMRLILVFLTAFQDSFRLLSQNLFGWTHSSSFTNDPLRLYWCPFRFILIMRLTIWDSFCCNSSKSISVLLTLRLMQISLGLVNNYSNCYNSCTCLKPTQTFLKLIHYF